MKKMSYLILGLLLMSFVSAVPSITVTDFKKLTASNAPISRDYLFTGEKVQYKVTVDASTYAMILANSNGARCIKNTPTTYTCTYTVGSMSKGNYIMKVRAYNMEGTKLVYSDTPTTALYFNPCMINSYTWSCNLNMNDIYLPMAISSNVLTFDQLVAGTTSYSNQVKITSVNQGGASSDIFIKGKPVFCSYTLTAPRCNWMVQYSPNNIEYSMDNGSTWTVLGTTEKKIGVDELNIKFRANTPTGFPVSTYNLAGAMDFKAVPIK
jgi:hypothetical protein